MIIDLSRFILEERPSWNELAALLQKIEQSPDRALLLDEAKRLFFLYQKASADLGRLATFASEPALISYLESLVGRAYGEIHESRRRERRWRFTTWFLREFPRAFRRQKWAIWLSVGVTLLGVLFGGLAVAVDNEAKEALLPSQFASHSGRPSARVAREEQTGSDRFGGRHATFAGQLIANNIRVSINAMALGVAWGIGTAILLFYNGVLIGLITVDYVSDGQGIFLLGWLLPHGVIEIPAVLIAGQAGFVLGRAVLGRGDHAGLTRRLRNVGADVATLIGGVACLLVWAGIVESFLSQLHQPVIPYGLKIAFGVVELCLLVWFLGWSGRRDPAAGGEGGANGS